MSICYTLVQENIVRKGGFMHQFNLDEAQTRLLELVEAAINGEDVYITKDDEQIIRLVPVVKKPKRRPQFGSAKGLITMSDDFDAPLEDFDEYTK